MKKGEQAPNDVFRAAASALESGFSGRIVLNAPLSSLTSLRVGGPAGLLAEPENEEDLIRIASSAAKLALPIMVLGRGTNLLVADEGFPGIVVRLSRAFEWVRERSRSVEAGGATPLPQVANWAARRSLAGMEFATAIPATVGGAVRMNAGAHRSEISTVLESARVCRLTEGRIEMFSKESLEMRYRSTLLGDGDVVCSASFKLQPGEREQITLRMRRHRMHRAATQPADQPNAGSFFKNPPGASAGQLIESAGLKGIRVRGAEVSRKHANFLVTHAGAKAQDVYELMAMVQSRVEQQTGVLLQPEVRMIGFFDDQRGKVRRG